ncbi:MAG: AAA family ATPase [Candidatus Buchananbacteria bacterium]
MPKQLIIGLTGTQGSGKDTVADWFKDQGFAYFSCSDIIRQECGFRQLETNRDNLIMIGNDLRKNFGHGILAEKILQQINEKNINRALVVSLRHPDEIVALKKSKNFFLINVDADQQTRFQRIKQRGRLEDSVDFIKFAQQEAQERTGSANQQQLNSVMALADFTITNDGSLAELQQKINQLYQKINL